MTLHYRMHIVRLTKALQVNLRHTYQYNIVGLVLSNTANNNLFHFVHYGAVTKEHCYMTW